MGHRSSSFSMPLHVTVGSSTERKDYESREMERKKVTVMGRRGNYHFEMYMGHENSIYSILRQKHNIRKEGRKERTKDEEKEEKEEEEERKKERKKI